MGGKVVDKSKVLDFIKSSDKPVTKKDILDTTGYSGDFKYCMKVLMNQNSELQRVGDRIHATYIWKPGKALYSEIKNPEGYNDFTAGKAIANVMKSSSNGKYPMRQHFGEVWQTSIAYDEAEGLLVGSAKEGVCMCYNVYPTKKPFMKDGYTLKWSDDLGTHYASILNPINCADRKLSKMVLDLKDVEKKAFAAMIRKVIDILPEPEATKTITIYKDKPVEVIKEVEIPVEKQVEVIKEVYKTDPMEIEMAVLKAKCEIYEKLLSLN